MESDPMPEQPCRVPLLEEDEAFPRIREIFRYERQKQGRVRNLTKVTANSPAAWQMTTRALQMYATLRKLDPALVDLLCLYVSVLNGCAYCVDDALGEAFGHGWTREQLAALGGRHEDAFPAATVAALRYAAAVTRDAQSVDDALMAELGRHFDAEALLEIGCVVGMKNFWNRLAISLRIPPEGKCSDREALAELLGVSRTLRETGDIFHAG